MSTEFIIIGFLLLLNAFFAFSEMAIVSASKPLLRQLAKQGRKSAITALDLAENPGRFLSTVQVGITLVGTLAGAYGGATIAEKLIEPLNAIPLIAPHGEGAAVFLVVTVITYLSVVVGELVPKQLALTNAERFAMFVARPMALLAAVCSPVVGLLEISAATLMRILGIRKKEAGVTETEIKAVIAEGVASGAIEDEEHAVIRRVIRLGDRSVASIMTPRTDVTFIDVDDTLADVRNKIATGGHARYPVIDKDTTRVIGIVKIKQILAAGKTDEFFRVADYLLDATFINENASCIEALNTFRQKSLHIAAVVDDQNAFAGLFTTSDLLEAVVGTIPSNYDSGDDIQIVRRDDGSWLVDGMTPIDELHMTIGLEDIPADGDYQTLGGFVLTQLRTGPAAGVWFAFAGYRFEIVDMDRHRIDKILIQKIAPPPPQ